MLRLTIPAMEMYDEQRGFLYTKAQTISLEHSLVSISKWEAKWKKPFLSQKLEWGKVGADYVRCMTLTQNVDPDVYLGLRPEQMLEITAYINDPMTATTVRDLGRRGENRVITSELIYCWMILYGIPFECQKWHLNRLLTLIRVCGAEGGSKQKMTQAEIMAQNRAVNAARRKQFKTRG